MLGAETPHTRERRPLKKVRKSFLNRIHQTDEQAPPEDVNSTTEDNQINILNSCLGLVEVNGKVCMGTQFMNACINITSVKIENHLFWKSVTLNVQIRQEVSHNSWEKSVERLEKSEDLEQVRWGQRIRRHYTQYPQLMTNYFNIIRSSDPQVCLAVKKARTKARRACDDIESKYMYRKLQSFAGVDSLRLLSLSYSQDLLKEMGHTVDEFVDWSKQNGLPCLFEKDCPKHLEIAKKFVACSTLSGSVIQEEAEYQTFLYNKDGMRQKVTAQYINVLEPTADGMFHSGYFIVKEIEHSGKNIKNEEAMVGSTRNSLDVLSQRIKEDTEWMNDSDKCQEFEILIPKKLKKDSEEDSS